MEAASTHPVHQVVGHLFRHEAGRMAAVLSRLLGPDQMETAEDIVQDTLIKAMEVWRFHGIPDNPQAWLYRVAKNKAIDFIRTAQRRHRSHDVIRQELRSEWSMSSRVNELFKEHGIQDSMLLLMFACCHPAIPPESQIALTLKVLGGLSTAEIAHAFLTNEEVVAKRIYRAREKMRALGISLDHLPAHELPQRLDNLLHVLYLLFNEGYHSTHPDKLIREDLCEEAMRLLYIILQQPFPDQTKSNGLMALMCLQASRFPARMDDAGMIILLERQDRSKWNRQLIQKGLQYLERSAGANELSAYSVEAAIASVHALAQSFQETNWGRLVELYQMLSKLKPGPIVELNKAIAVGYANGPAAAIDLLKQLDGLQENFLYWSALGDVYARHGQQQLARESYARAIRLTTSSAEIQLLASKLDRLGAVI